MLAAIRKALLVPSIPYQAVATVTTVAAFYWLLANDLIQPLAVFALQLFLAF